jgi:hypothetical protein
MRILGAAVRDSRALPFSQRATTNRPAKGLSTAKSTAQRRAVPCDPVAAQTGGNNPRFVEAMIKDHQAVVKTDVTIG